jgi:hypothetical protein
MDEGRTMTNLPYIAVSSATILANAGAVAADIAKADFVVKNCDDLGVARSWLPVLASLKAAGAAGMLLGLFGVPAIGTAGAAGLVAFFTGAVLTHVRARVLYNIAFPGVFLALAAASLALSLSK